MKIRTDNRSERGTKITLNLIGAAATLAGGVFVLQGIGGAAIVLLAGMTAVVSGLTIIVTTTLSLRLAKATTALVVSVLSAVGAVNTPFGPPLLGFAMAILLAAILISSRAAAIVAGLSAALYAAAFTLNGKSDPVDGTTVVVVLAIFGVIEWFFAPADARRNAAELEQKTLELEAALAELQNRQLLELETGSEIKSLTTDLTTVSRAQSQGVGEQVAAVTEVTSTIEELSTAAGQIADTTAQLSAQAEQVLVAVSRSQAAVSDNSTTMALIKSQMMQIVERSLALNKRIQRISDVAKAVGSIAANTHLLALNAAIEAAGAGESGAGFAVVASEFKKLAQQTQAESQKIGLELDELLKANSASIMATEQGLKETDKGAATAQVTYETNDEVSAIIREMVEMSATITMATQQQRSASGQAVATMYQLRRAAEGVAGQAQTIDAAVISLSALAAQLGALLTSSAENGNQDSKKDANRPFAPQARTLVRVAAAARLAN